MARPISKSVQEIYAPTSSCFGCGPANPRGLHLRSFADGDMLVADWQARDYHEAFADVLCGGIIGTLLDCHSTWAAAMYLMRQRRQDFPPCVVTSQYEVKLLWPTSTKEPVRLGARVTECVADRVVVDATLTADGKACASCHGIFVTVKPGHPAYHRC